MKKFLSLCYISLIFCSTCFSAESLEKSCGEYIGLSYGEVYNYHEIDKIVKLSLQIHNKENKYLAKEMLLDLSKQECFLASHLQAKKNRNSEEMKDYIIYGFHDTSYIEVDKFSERIKKAAEEIK